MDDRRNYIE